MKIYKAESTVYIGHNITRAGRETTFYFLTRVLLLCFVDMVPVIFLLLFDFCSENYRTLLQYLLVKPLSFLDAINSNMEAMIIPVNQLLPVVKDISLALT
jgi:hypothetical protein